MAAGAAMSAPSVGDVKATVGVRGTPVGVTVAVGVDVCVAVADGVSVGVGVFVGPVVGVGVTVGPGLAGDIGPLKTWRSSILPANWTLNPLLSGPQPTVRK